MSNRHNASHEAPCIKQIIESGFKSLSPDYDNRPLEDNIQVGDNTLFAVCGACAVSMVASAGSEDIDYSSEPCLYK